MKMTGRGMGRPFRRGGRGRAGAPGRSLSGKLQKVRAITPKDAPDLVEWLTQPSASAPSSSSLSTPSSLSAVSTAKDTTTTTISPPLESEESFSNPFQDLTDAQPFLASDQEEEVSTVVTQQSAQEGLSPLLLPTPRSLMLVVGKVTLMMTCRWTSRWGSQERKRRGV